MPDLITCTDCNCFIENCICFQKDPTADFFINGPHKERSETDRRKPAQKPKEDGE